MAEDQNEDDDSSEGEDLIGDMIPTPSESTNSVAADSRFDDDFEDSSQPAESHNDHDLSFSTESVPAPPTPTSQSQLSESQGDTHSFQEQQPTQTYNTLRSRSTAQSSVPTLTATSSSSSSSSAHATARAALFANRRKPTTTPETSTATTEAILDSQRQEQDALSGSILKMAGALKSSSQKFSTTLDADKDLVGRAGEGMSKTERGMEAARGRMGTLRRMTEGKGWWGRMILYAWVYGLMLALVLLVFVMPKLRF